MSEIARTEAADIARLCCDCGVPHMAAGFLAEGITLDEAKTRISVVGTAMEIVALARRKEPSIPADLAATMLADHKSIAEIRAEVFERIVAAEEAVGEISSHAPLPMSTADHARMAGRASMERALREQGMEPIQRTGR